MDAYKEIDKAIHQAEAAEWQSKEKDSVIDRLRKQISLLDCKANPQRYSLSSGAELVRVNVSNYRNPSLHIWTRVGEELFENIKFQIDYEWPKDISTARSRTRSLSMLYSIRKNR